MHAKMDRNEKHNDTVWNVAGRPVLSERLAGRQAALVEHPRQEGNRWSSFSTPEAVVHRVTVSILLGSGGAVERAGRPDEADHGGQLLPERQVCRGRHLRRPLRLLHDRTAQVLHADPRAVDARQERQGPQDHRHRVAAQRGQGGPRGRFLRQAIGSPWTSRFTIRVPF